jgi:hypothetical protein
MIHNRITRAMIESRIARIVDRAWRCPLVRSFGSFEELVTDGGWFNRSGGSRPSSASGRSQSPSGVRGSLRNAGPRDVVLPVGAHLRLLKLVGGTTDKADMPLKIGTGEKTRREWFLRTLFCWFLIVAIFAAIKFL